MFVAFRAGKNLLRSYVDYMEYVYYHRHADEARIVFDDTNHEAWEASMLTEMRSIREPYRAMVLRGNQLPSSQADEKEVNRYAIKMIGSCCVLNMGMEVAATTLFLVILWRELHHANDMTTKIISAGGFAIILDAGDAMTPVLSFYYAGRTSEQWFVPLLFRPDTIGANDFLTYVAYMKARFTQGVKRRIALFYACCALGTGVLHFFWPFIYHHRWRWRSAK